MAKVGSYNLPGSGSSGEEDSPKIDQDKFKKQMQKVEAVDKTDPDQATKKRKPGKEEEDILLASNVPQEVAQVVTQTDHIFETKPSKPSLKATSGLSSAQEKSYKPQGSLGASYQEKPAVEPQPPQDITDERSSLGSSPVNPTAPPEQPQATSKPAQPSELYSSSDDTASLDELEPMTTSDGSTHQTSKSTTRHHNHDSRMHDFEKANKQATESNKSPSSLKAESFFSKDELGPEAINKTNTHGVSQDTSQTDFDKMKPKSSFTEKKPPLEKSAPSYQKALDEEQKQKRVEKGLEKEKFERQQGLNKLRTNQQPIESQLSEVKTKDSKTFLSSKDLKEKSTHEELPISEKNVSEPKTFQTEKETAKDFTFQKDSKTLLSSKDHKEKFAQQQIPHSEKNVSEPKTSQTEKETAKDFTFQRAPTFQPPHNLDTKRESEKTVETIKKTHLEHLDSMSLDGSIQDPLMAAQTLPPLASNPTAPDTAPLQSYLSSDVHELFQTMVGVVMIKQLTQEKMAGTQTEVSLTNPEYAKSPFYGLKIIVTEYKTAPGSFNIELQGNGAQNAILSAQAAKLISAFGDNRYNLPFTVNRLEITVRKDEKDYLFKRKESMQGEKDNHGQSRH